MNRFLCSSAIHLVVGVGVMYFDNLAKRRNDVSGQAGVGRTITRSAGLPKKEWVLPHSTLRSASCWGIALLDNVIYSIQIWYQLIRQQPLFSRRRGSVVCTRCRMLYIPIIDESADTYELENWITYYDDSSENNYVFFTLRYK